MRPASRSWPCTAATWTRGVGTTRRLPSNSSVSSRPRSPRRSSAAAETAQRKLDVLLRDLIWREPAIHAVPARDGQAHADDPGRDDRYVDGRELARVDAALDDLAHVPLVPIAGEE